MFDQNMTSNYDFDSTISGNNNVIDNNIDINMMSNDNTSNPNNICQNINDGVQQKCVHRTFIHEINHVCPIHTHVINHHIYRHTYRPQYSCSEENTVSNVQCGSCCQFK